MNKTAIKNFSIWARNKLIVDISYRAGLMGVTKSGIADPLPQSTDMTEFYDIGTAEPYTISGIEVRQRKDLVDAIHRKETDSDYETAYHYIIEEVAYTWFNRLIAVRFMEVNDYLPSHIRVLSSESGKMEPDLVTTPFDADLNFTAEEERQIIRLKRENDLDGVFRILFVKQCNVLNSILPVLFEKTGDYTELLLNLSVVDRDGVVYHLVHDIDEADFDIETKDENGNPIGQVEIIGWLYQYYNTEPKNETFALLKKNIKVTKERIPSATQLFTPDWIVRYMVENSLGRLWLEGHPNNELRAGWKYYLDEAEQEPEVEEQLDEIRKEHFFLTPEDIKIIDPCMGSGHILVYAFDVLMQIYETQGFIKQDAVKSILENNLYGLDIDERAAQLAYFAVMMKARSYDRRFFIRNIQPHIYAIQESNGLSDKWLSVHEQMKVLFDSMKDAKEYGSIIETPDLDYSAIHDSVKKRLCAIGQVDFGSAELQYQLSELLSLIDIAEIMSKKYDVVVTNPPYMGGNGMDKELCNFVKEYYPDGKNDLFAVFLERCGQMTKINGYQAMITMQSWMYLSSFETLRCKIIEKKNIVNMLHLGMKAFNNDVGTIVQTASFTIRNTQIYRYKGIYFRLIESTVQEEKENMYLAGENCYIIPQDDFFQIPGCPIAYWLNENVFSIFRHCNSNVSDFSCGEGKNVTTDNAKFIRFHWEVVAIEVGAFNKKWLPCAMGGEYRKWYGNVINVIDWSVKARTFYHQSPAGRVIKEEFWNMPGVTWGKIGFNATNFRFLNTNQMYQETAILQKNIDETYFVLALLNSKTTKFFLSFLSPTINFQLQDICSVPICEIPPKSLETIKEYSNDCICLSKSDWDSFEISWDFQRHPMVQFNSTVDAAFSNWKSECDTRFHQLQTIEEKLNQIFIEAYGLQDELTPEVDYKDVTVREADLNRDIQSLLSFAVGCMFGRYSLDMDGLAYAGGDWDDNKYTSFKPDADDIIPITDEEYLEDDIVTCLCQWLKVVYGEETLEENLDFIAQALGNKGDSSREVIRNYFLKDFFTDHCKIYQKRPIYWLFDSGKQNGFKALVYLHRYTPDTIGNLRIDYLHRMQRIYDGEISRMQDTIDHSDNSREVTKATKRKEKLQKQLKECQEYDEKISHLALSRIELDLDDGVKVNYEKVQTAQDGKKYQVLAKI